MHHQGQVFVLSWSCHVALLLRGVGWTRRGAGGSVRTTAEGPEYRAGAGSGAGKARVRGGACALDSQEAGSRRGAGDETSLVLSNPEERMKAAYQGRRGFVAAEDRASTKILKQQV